MADAPNENLVDELAEEFARRWRSGERPTIEDYLNKYPEWADEIRDIFPGVLMLEQLKPSIGDTDPPPRTMPIVSCVPERLGEYRIIREIGRGGMGVVYEAMQESLGRHVALKVLPAHLLANEKMRSRFHRESQAAARLHHTNIVPVFGVGESEGQCFYVMQLIEGRGLDQFIRSMLARQAPESGRPIQPSLGTTVSGCGEPVAWRTERTESVAPVDEPPVALSIKEVARIGVQVADALEYAHSQGILHRDVKPSNLLLDERGAVWITDFGVAKLLEEVNLTVSGDLVGTLKYMPPERFAGQSDARGDVYSLGITLYELLVLRSAFPDTTPHHLIHLISKTDLPLLRKVNPAIPADLETIILKAAARDPAHRYQTSGELAADLRRFLDDRPILARRAGPLEQAWRWCRRNPALATTTMTMFVLMVAITLVSVAAYVRTRSANRETEQANQEMEKALLAEQTQREHAETTSTLALEALNRMYDRFAPTRLVVTPQSSDEEGAELPTQPALPPEAVPLLEELLRTYEQIAQASREFPKLQALAAEANHHIGEIRQRLGRHPEAASAYRSAIDLYTRLPADILGDAGRIKLVRSYNELGRALHAQHQYEESARMHRRAIDTLTEAPKDQATKPEFRYELARTYHALAQREMFLAPPPGPGGRFGRERPPPSERSESPPGQRAIEILERLVGEHPSVPEYRHLLACCYRDVPPERPGPGRPPPTGPRSDRAVELLRELVRDFPRVPDYQFDLCETLARPVFAPRRGALPFGVMYPQDRLDEAISLSAKLVAQYPNVPQYTAAHAQYHDRLGIALQQARKHKEAEKKHRAAVALQTRLVKQYPHVVAYGIWLSLMERSLGRVLSEQNQLQEARSRLEAAAHRLEQIRQKEPALGPLRMALGITYLDLARVLDRAGDKVAAKKAQQKAEKFSPPRKGFRKEGG